MRDVRPSGDHNAFELRECLVKCVCRQHDHTLRTWLDLHRTVYHPAEIQEQHSRCA